MKKVRLNDLENNKSDKLKQYKLDKDSINEFRSKTKQVSEEESNKLALELFELIRSDKFNDDFEKIVEFVYNGANVNQLDVGENLLNICLRNNYIQTFIVLLKTGIDVNMKNNKGITPLMMCAKLGNKEILELLILMGADVNLKNEFGDTAISIALKNNHKECADILISAQAYFNSNDIDRYNLSTLKDKSVSSIIENSTPNLIKEAEDLLNNIDNNYNNCNLTNEIIFDLLTEDQIFENNRLDLFDKYGTKRDITDFAILLGGYVNNYYHSSDGNSLYRTGGWWTKSLLPTNYWNGDNIRIVNELGNESWSLASQNFNGICPVIPYSSISSNGVKNNFGIKEVQYGEYPQTIVDEDFSFELETAYNNKNLRATDKIYTTYTTYFEEGRAKTHIEYEYKGNKFIRFYHIFRAYWVKVEPIAWLVDEKSNIALSKKILISGLQINNSDHYDGIFENTDMYRFLNEIFAKDIIPSKINKLEDDDEKEKILENRKESGIKKSIKKLVKKFLDS